LKGVKYQKNEAVAISEQPTRASQCPIRKLWPIYKTKAITQGKNMNIAICRKQPIKIRTNVRNKDDTAALPITV